MAAFRSVSTRVLKWCAAPDGKLSTIRRMFLPRSPSRRSKSSTWVAWQTLKRRKLRVWINKKLGGDASATTIHGDGRDGRDEGGNRSIRGVANELYYDERSRREAELDAAFLEEGAEDEHENDDFIVPDDVDSDSGNEKNKSDADTPAGERKKRVLVDSDEEE